MITLILLLSLSKSEKCAQLPYSLAGQEWKCADSVCELECTNGQISKTPVAIKCICPFNSDCFYVRKYNEYAIGMDFELVEGFIEKSGFDCSTDQQFYQRVGTFLGLILEMEDKLEVLVFLLEFRPLNKSYCTLWLTTSSDSWNMVMLQ